MRRFATFFALIIALHIFAQNDIEVVNIENRAVQEYMQDAYNTYSVNHNYSHSVVTKYNNASKYGPKLHWPAGKHVSWTNTAPLSNIREIRITVSENQDYTGTTYTFNPSEKNDREFTIRNLFPNKTYYYKVEEFLNDGSVNQLKQGVFRTEGQVRMIQVRNCGNVRDIGGWQSQYGGTIKYGRLYRSASLNRVTPEGRHDFVDNLNVRAELDLRHEVNQSKSSLGSNVDYDRRRHEAGTKGLAQCRTDFVKDLKFILRHLRQGHAVDWHCAIGCDRCGLVSFLIEGLLGMSEIDLARDFELSTFSLASSNKRPRAHIKSMIDYIKKYGPADDLKQCFYNYWKQIGMPTQELDFFIAEMLEDSPATTPTAPANPDPFEIKMPIIPSTPVELKPYQSLDSQPGIITSISIQ